MKAKLFSARATRLADGGARLLPSLAVGAITRNRSTSVRSAVLSPNSCSSIHTSSKAAIIAGSDILSIFEFHAESRPESTFSQRKYLISLFFTPNFPSAFTSREATLDSKERDFHALKHHACYWRTSFHTLTKGLFRAHGLQELPSTWVTDWDMPWKESSAMSERVRMIVEELNGVAGSKSGLAARYGVSRKTLYKWLKRFEAGSWDDLKDRSRAPRRHPNALPSEMVARVLELKRRYPFWVRPSCGRSCAPSTVSARPRKARSVLS